MNTYIVLPVVSHFFSCPYLSISHFRCPLILWKQSLLDMALWICSFCTKLLHFSHFQCHTHMFFYHWISIDTQILCQIVLEQGLCKDLRTGGEVHIRNLIQKSYLDTLNSKDFSDSFTQVHSKSMKQYVQKNSGYDTDF